MSARSMRTFDVWILFILILSASLSDLIAHNTGARHQTVRPSEHIRLSSSITTAVESKKRRFSLLKRRFRSSKGNWRRGGERIPERRRRARCRAVKGGRASGRRRRGSRRRRLKLERRGGIQRRYRVLTQCNAEADDYIMPDLTH
jgi:hypothetical protein